MESSGQVAGVAASGLRHRFGDVTALDGIDLAVPAGSVFALLGPNGSGKTTAVRILATLLLPDEGDAAVLGHSVRTDPGAVRSMIGVTGQFAAVDGLLTGRQNLQLCARLLLLSAAQARRQAAELLDRFDLGDAGDRLASTYSGGMRRRLDLAMTLVGRPRVLFLDEPTTGLDPRSRRAVWDEVRGLVAEGVTAFLTTQYLEEADQLADRVAVLDRGRIVADGPPDALKRRVGGTQVRLRFLTPADRDRAADCLRASVRGDGPFELRVPVDGDAGSVRRLLDRLPDDLALEDLAIVTPTLDDVFLELTGAAAAVR